MEVAFGYHEALFEFDDFYECGLGFWASSGDGTAGLLISLDGLLPATDGPLPTTSLVDGPWRAEVIVGEHLFENWCNDIVIEDGPVTRTDHRWPATAGEIEFLGVNVQDAGARVSGLTIEPPGAEPYVVADFVILNGCWDCYAG